MTDALSLTLVGITVVFVALILLSFIISIFSSILNIKKKDKSNSAGTEEQASVIETMEEQNKTEVKEDDDLIAVLTAAVMASMRHTPNVKIRVKSFRRISQDSPAWNVAGRNQHISSKL